MKKIITNIEIKNNYIYITYFDNTKTKIIYNEINKNNLLNYLIKEKQNLLNYKKLSKRIIIISTITILIDIICTLSTYILFNNFIFNLFISILSFDIVIFNLIFYNGFKEDYKNIKKILENININLLPNEKEYLKNKKIINLKDYIEKKEQKIIFNYYDYDYPGYIPKKEKKFNDNSPGKILEFKRK